MKRKTRTRRNCKFGRRRKSHKYRGRGGTNHQCVGCNPNSGPTPTPNIFMNPINPQHGGSNNNNFPVPGHAWTSNPNSWSGSNYYKLNTYNNDVSRQIIDVGANPPFTVGGKRKRRSYKKNRRRSHHRKQKKGGAGFSNFLGQDFINVGRQLDFGANSAYNILAGKPAPVNPLPFEQKQ